MRFLNASIIDKNHSIKDKPMVSQLKLISLLFAAVIFSIAGCSDDSSTGADQPEAPAVPEAVPAEINSSIFENNSVAGEEYALFNEAAIITQTAAAQINGVTIPGQTYLEFTRSNESVFEDGVWTWTFTSSQSGVDVSVRTTAEQLQNGYQWNINISGSFNGESITEFLFLSGFISDDGNTGNWQYFSPGQGEQPILEYLWEVTDEAKYSFSSVIAGSSSEDQQRIDYVRDGADNTLSYTGLTSGGDLEIYWNSDTGTGYIDREGEDRRCWDASFAETSCS